jgi:hypothetical protein
MSQGFTSGVPIDVDSTFAANSDMLVPSQKAVKTAMDLKANLLSSDFTQLLLASKAVASFENGSNANGRWAKWYDKDGNVLVCIQYAFGLSKLVNDTITFPVAFPDTNIGIYGQCRGASTAQFILFSATTTGATSANRNYSGGSAGTLNDCEYLAWWVKT